MVTVYKKDSCVQCDATIKYLNKYNIPHETRSVDELTPEQIGTHQQAPVVIPHDGDSWSGYRPDLIRTLVR